MDAAGGGRGRTSGISVSITDRLRSAVATLVDAVLKNLCSPRTLRRDGIFIHLG